MKIMHFVAYYPPERLGGVGECVAKLHEALLARGHDSVVVTAGRVSTERIRRIARRPLAWILATALQVRSAARCDVVHFQAGEAFPALLLLRMMRRRPRILTTFHVSYKGMADSVRPYTLEGRRFGGDLRTLLYRFGTCTVHHWMDRSAARLADTVNTISLQSAREIIGDETRAHIVYYGLPPLPRYLPQAASVELLYAGAPGHRKRILALPFILERVRREIPGARLRIIGFDLDAQPALRALFDEKGLLPHVECLGRRASIELPPHYQAAGVVLVPSAYEGLPFVILESMQCGAAVVATRVSGHPEAIRDGENGFLVDLDDTVTMADRCVQLLKDPALRERIGQSAQRTIAERFTLERHVEEYLDLYRRLAGEKQP